MPGVIAAGGRPFLLSCSPAAAAATAPGRAELVLGLVALIAAVILLSPFCLAALARLGRHAPIAVRLALRDLARYRARSGSALAAISLGVLIAVIVCVVAAARYANVLDYAGPNLASNQLIVYTPNGPRPGGPGQRSRRGGDGKHSCGRWRRARTASPPRSATHDIDPARHDERHAPARRGRAQLVRAGLRRHPVAAPGLRDQRFAGRPDGRHPHHAARACPACPTCSSSTATTQRHRPRDPERAETIPVPEERLPRQPA